MFKVLWAKVAVTKTSPRAGARRAGLAKSGLIKMVPKPLDRHGMLHLAERASRRLHVSLASAPSAQCCSPFTRVARAFASSSVAPAFVSAVIPRLPSALAGTTRHRALAPHSALPAQSRCFASAAAAVSSKAPAAPAAPPAPFATVVSSPIPVGADQALRITDSCVQVCTEYLCRHLPPNAFIALTFSPLTLILLRSPEQVPLMDALFVSCFCTTCRSV